MSGFDIDWLDLREDADRRARDKALLEQALQWLKERPSTEAVPVVLDLGAGTGSTLRAFSSAGYNPASLHWRLLDHDPVLLAEAWRRHGDEHRIETCITDLAKPSSLPLAGTQLVTASALFDLVSASFIEALADALQTLRPHQASSVYAALNYDGVMRWTPTHPLDDSVLVAFNRDQRTNKGFGQALGPKASRHTEHIFHNSSYRVFTASSPWQLHGADKALTDALIDGITNAVADRIDHLSLADWTRFRHDNVITGTCMVGHTDILALPG